MYVNTTIVIHPEILFKNPTPFPVVLNARDIIAPESKIESGIIRSNKSTLEMYISNKIRII